MIDEFSNKNSIQGVVLYIEEVYLKKKHRLRRSSSHDIKTEKEIATTIERVDAKVIYNGVDEGEV